MFIENNNNNNNNNNISSNLMINDSCENSASENDTETLLTGETFKDLIQCELYENGDIFPTPENSPNHKKVDYALWLDSIDIINKVNINENLPLPSQLQPTPFDSLSTTSTTTTTLQQLPTPPTITLRIPIGRKTIKRTDKDPYNNNDDDPDDDDDDDGDDEYDEDGDDDEDEDEDEDDSVVTNGQNENDESNSNISSSSSSSSDDDDDDDDDDYDSDNISHSKFIKPNTTRLLKTTKKQLRCKQTLKIASFLDIASNWRKTKKTIVSAVTSVTKSSLKRLSKNALPVQLDAKIALSTETYKHKYKKISKTTKFIEMPNVLFDDQGVTESSELLVYKKEWRLTSLLSLMSNIGKINKSLIKTDFGETLKMFYIEFGYDACIYQKPVINNTLLYIKSYPFVHGAIHENMVPAVTHYLVEYYKNNERQLADGELETFAFCYNWLSSMDLVGWKNDANRKKDKLLLLYALKCIPTEKLRLELAAYIDIEDPYYISSLCALFIKQKYLAIIYDINENSKTIEKANEGRLVWNTFMRNCKIHHFLCPHTLVAVSKWFDKTQTVIGHKMADLRLQNFFNDDSAVKFTTHDVINLFRFLKCNFKNTNSDAFKRLVSTVNTFYSFMCKVYVNYICNFNILEIGSSNLTVATVDSFCIYLQRISDLLSYNNSESNVPVFTSKLIQFEKFIIARIKAITSEIYKDVKIEKEATIQLFKVINLMLLKRVEYLRFENIDITPVDLYERIIECINSIHGDKAFTNLKYKEFESSLDDADILEQYAEISNTSFEEEDDDTIQSDEEDENFDVNIDQEEVNLLMEPYDGITLLRQNTNKSSKCKKRLLDDDNVDNDKPIKKRVKKMMMAMMTSPNDGVENVEKEITNDPEMDRQPTTNNTVGDINDLLSTAMAQSEIDGSISGITLENQQMNYDDINNDNNQQYLGYTLIVDDISSDCNQQVNSGKDMDLCGAAAAAVVVTKENDNDKIKIKAGRKRFKLDNLDDSLTPYVLQDYDLEHRALCVMCKQARTKKLIRKNDDYMVVTCLACYTKLVTDYLSESPKYPHDILQNRIIKNYKLPLAFKGNDLEFIDDAVFDKTVATQNYNKLYETRKYAYAQKCIARKQKKCTNKQINGKKQ